VCVEVDLSHTADLKNYDIVHLFNLTRPDDTALQLRNAKRQGKPVCLSTIYWNMDELRNLIALKEPFWLPAARRCKLLLKQVLSLANAKSGHNDEASVMKDILFIKKLQREVLEGVDMLLPNSTTELNLLKKDFPSISSKPAKVVYNCIDGEVFGDVVPLDHELEPKNRSGDFLLIVGRIDQRKNQGSLLNAMRSTDIPVVMVGDVSSRSYYYLAFKPNMKKKTDCCQQEIMQS
jgi:glycosyltransferase involved in cell wall biosynthesis